MTPSEMAKSYLPKKGPNGFERYAVMKLFEVQEELRGFLAREGLSDENRASIEAQLIRNRAVIKGVRETVRERNAANKAAK